MTQNQTYAAGVEISPADLIRARPDRAITGFAPGGRVTTHMFGANRSVFRGRGMEFAESRVYQPGDELRTIDWRLTARSSKVHTKLFHEERERPVYILLDLRAMMRFGTRTRFKSHLAAEIAATLAWVGHDGGDRVGGFILTPDRLIEFPAARTRTSLLSFLHAISDGTLLEPHSAKTEPSMDRALRNLYHVCRPGTLAFVISDFSDLDPKTEIELQRVALRAHMTLLFLSDPMDARLPRSAGRLSDGEALLALSQMRTEDFARHEEAFRARETSLTQMARKCGMAYWRIRTTDDPSAILRPKKIPRKARTRAEAGA